MLNRIKGVKHKIAFHNKCFCLSQGQSQFRFFFFCLMGFVILSKTVKFKVTQCQTFDEDFYFQFCCCYCSIPNRCNNIS